MPRSTTCGLASWNSQQTVVPHQVPGRVRPFGDHPVQRLRRQEPGLRVVSAPAARHRRNGALHMLVMSRKRIDTVPGSCWCSR